MIVHNYSLLFIVKYSSISCNSRNKLALISNSLRVAGSSPVRKTSLKSFNCSKNTVAVFWGLTAADKSSKNSLSHQKLNQHGLFYLLKGSCVAINLIVSSVLKNIHHNYAHYAVSDFLYQSRLKLLPLLIYLMLLTILYHPINYFHL